MIKKSLLHLLSYFQIALYIHKKLSKELKEDFTESKRNHNKLQSNMSVKAKEKKDFDKNNDQ